MRRAFTCPSSMRSKESPASRVYRDAPRTNTCRTLQTFWARCPCTREDAACVVRPPCRSQAIDLIADFLPSSYSTTALGPLKMGTTRAV
ncbi:hypothetical protein VTO73DRAFT_2774 [Trametes versicolor]